MRQEESVHPQIVFYLFKCPEQLLNIYMVYYSRKLVWGMAIKQEETGSAPKTPRPLNLMLSSMILNPDIVCPDNPALPQGQCTRKNNIFYVLKWLQGLRPSFKCNGDDKMTLAGTFSFTADVSDLAPVLGRKWGMDALG